jgi:hypothetical protein
VCQAATGGFDISNAEGLLFGGWAGEDGGFGFHERQRLKFGKQKALSGRLRASE